jgi:hypothetical protein
MASRAESGLMSNWLWTVDRPLIGAIGLLMLCGIVFGLAASPAGCNLRPSISCTVRRFTSCQR